MNRRVAAVLVALALPVAACSGGGDDEPTVQELPPTTITTTPILPTGAADTVRRWVEAVADDEPAAFAMLAPESQAAIGGPEGYAAARAELQEEWGRWAGAPRVAYDAVPVTDGVVAVIVHGATEDGYEAGAVPLRVDAAGEDWLVDPLGSTGDYQAVPEDGSTVEAEPELSVLHEPDAEVLVFVDGQRSTQAQAVPAGGGEDRVTYAPERPLSLGWHVATFVFRRGAALTARAAPYLVEEA